MHHPYHSSLENSSREPTFEGKAPIPYGKPYSGWMLNRMRSGGPGEEERIFIEFVTSDIKLKASKKGLLLKTANYDTPFFVPVTTG
jgi:hypothetical protein